MTDQNAESAKSIFMAALDLDPAERPAFIARECEGDAALQREVEALLAAHDGKPILDPATASAAQKSASADASSVSETAGTRIGPFKLLQQIGEGGFGVVFMADQEQPVRRRVALKIIKLGMDTRRVVARFEAERQALAMMDHPHIARVLDAGATESGRPYFVMELVKGDPITEYCDRNNLSISERLKLFTQVCNAVQHAHTKGVIHRDIKPSNVLVHTQDGQPHAKVIDFGIAKATDHRLTEKTLFTEHKALIGTPAYMSPEQAEGSMDIDTRTDVYSLGVLMYELLTGTTPFDNTKLRAAAFAEMQRIIRETEPPKPSTRLFQSAETLGFIAARRRIEPKKLGILVRGELDWIVMKALDKDRARRYETANAFAADVQRHLTGEPVLAAPPGVGYRVRKFVRKHKAGAFIAVTMVLATITTSGVSVWAMGERARAEVAAMKEALAREEAVGERQRADTERDAAKLNAYAANVAFAQFAMANRGWDEARRKLNDCPVEMRGWEWQYLVQKANSVLFELPPADSLDFGLNGERIVTLGNGNAYFWDSQTGLPIGGMADVYDANFSPDGKFILTVSSSGNARIWDAQSYQPVGESLRYEDSISKADFSPDGKFILTISSSGEAQIWDAQSYQSVGESMKHESVQNADFSPDGRVLLTVSNQTVRVWDVATRRPIGREIKPDNGVESAVLGPDCKFILTISFSNRAQLWDAVSSDPIGAALIDDEDTSSACFSPDGKLLITESYGTIRLLDSATRMQVMNQRNFDADESSVNFSPDGHRISVIRSLGYVSRGCEIIDLERFDPPQQILDGDDIDLEIAAMMNGAGDPLLADPAGSGWGTNILTPDGTRRVVIDGSNVRFVEPTSGCILSTIWADSPATQMRFTPDGTRLVLQLGESRLMSSAEYENQLATITDSGGALVWDIREPSRRRADLVARLAENKPAEEYVTNLLAGPLKNNELIPALLADPSLSTIRRAVAMELLRKLTSIGGLVCHAQDQIERHGRDGASRAIERLMKGTSDDLLAVQGTIEGRLDGRRLIFKYREYGNTGEGSFELSADGQSFVGKSRRNERDSWFEWTGRRKLGDDPSHFSGVWDTNFELLWLFTEGDVIRGYYNVDQSLTETLKVIVQSMPKLLTDKHVPLPPGRLE